MHHPLGRGLKTLVAYIAGREVIHYDIELLVALVQALHVCLDDTALCESLLATPEAEAQHLQIAMIVLSDCMPHDLTARACMGRLCEVALTLTQPGSQKYVSAASRHFENVLCCLRNAMQVID